MERGERTASPEDRLSGSDRVRTMAAII